VNGQQMNFLNTAETALSYKINKDSNGNYVFAITIDSFKLKADAAGRETEININNAHYSIDPVQKMFSVLKGFTYTALVTPSRKVVSVEGQRELDGRMRAYAQQNKLPVQEGSMLVSQFMSDQVVRDMLEKNFRFLPDSALPVGTRWVDSSTSRYAEMSMKVANTYQLMETDATTALITMKGTIDNPQASMTFSNIAVTAVLSGNQTGNARIYTSTGLVKKATTDINISGKVEAMGRSIPVKINIQTTTTGQIIK
jgi:hypothetical protein